MQRQIDYILVGCAPAAVCVAGVETQEYQYLSEGEREELIRRVVAMVDARAAVIIGVSHASFRRSIELAHLAEEVGASAVQLLLPNRPFGGPASVAEIVEYVEMIAEATDLPLVAYHNPGPGAALSAGQVVTVATLESVRCLKESSRNVRHVGLVIKEVELAGHAHVFVTMEVLLAGLTLGAAGAMAPPPAAVFCSNLISAFREGDFSGAGEYQRLLSEMPARWIEYGLAPVMKEAMRCLGVDCGDPHPPFGNLPADARASLRTFLGDLTAGILAGARPAYEL
jgi:4-hydroxy-tetrahydrodipicolinate synthase